MKRIQTKTQVVVMRRNAWFLFCTCVLLFLLLTPGCNNKFFDPTQVGRFRPVPAVNVILDTLGVAEETSVAWEQAEDPQPSDTVITESDYALNSGDTVRISIFELFQEGVTFVNDFVVTETGRISIPEVGVIEAAGLTETQLEDQIKQILAKDLLKEPSVVVTLIGSQQRAFSILGDGVATPGRYGIPRYDYRLADAIATAGGSSQFNVSYIYVSRYVKEKEPIGAPKQPAPKELKDIELIEPELPGPELTEPKLPGPELTEPELIEPEQKSPEMIKPRAQRQWPQSRVVVATSEMITDKELAQAALPEDSEILSDGQRDWKDVKKKPESSVEPAAPEPAEETIKNEPVSVKDILKTLSERSGRGRTTGARTITGREVREPGAKPSVLQPMVELPTNEQIDVNEETPAFSEMPRWEKIKERAGAKKAVEPSAGVGSTGREKTSEGTDIDAILKSLPERQRPQVGKGAEEKVAPLEEPIGREQMKERIDVEETPAFPEVPRREKISEQQAATRKVVRPSAGVGSTGRDETGKEADIDAILKSLSERQRPQVGKEAEEAVAPLEEPIGQERMEEQIGVDETLKTLSKRPQRPRRERIEQPVEEGVGVEEALKSLAEPGAPEIPEEQIKIEGVLAPSTKPVAPEKVVEEEAGRVEWIFQDGKWVPVQVGPPKPIAPVIGVEPGEELISPFEEEGKPVQEFEWDRAVKARLIRIPADKLLAGDPKCNIVIKPGDTIHVPVDVIGEFCIMGNVNAQGYVNTTGRPMTLKMAIAAAGGLGPLAWPKTCEVVRRIGKKKEEIVLVNLDKIASGEQPDFFIKPNDLINVGTHPTSRWLAVLRNAFRATYGFGFVYDRNFAEKDLGQFWP